jgi:membrane protein implicated in regulation of membrane protease activity
VKTFTNSLFWCVFALILVAFALSVPTMTVSAMLPIPWGTQAAGPYVPPVETSIDWQAIINIGMPLLLAFLAWLGKQVWSETQSHRPALAQAMRQAAQEAVMAVEQVAKLNGWDSAQKREQAIQAAHDYLQQLGYKNIYAGVLAMLVESAVRTYCSTPTGLTAWDQSDGVPGEADPMKDIEAALSTMLPKDKADFAIKTIEALIAQMDDENPAEGAQK